MNTRMSLCAGILGMLILSGCARTQVTEVWKRPEFSGPPMASLIILAQTGREYNRAAWENIIAGRYRSSGMQAEPAINEFPDSSGAGIDRVISNARQKGIEGVLVVRTTGTRNVETYHPPEAHYYYGPGWYPYPYRRWYYHGYYGPYPYPRYSWYDPYAPFSYYDYDVVVTPGYTSYHRVATVESYLYQSVSGDQVWSMSTETLDPPSENSLVDDISRSTYQSLLRYGLIRLTR